MWKEILTSLGQMKNRSRKRRELEELLKFRDSRVFDDIGIPRAEIMRLYRRSRFF